MWGCGVRTVGCMWALSMKILWWPEWHAHWCVVWWHGEATVLGFVVWRASWWWTFRLLSAEMKRPQFTVAFSSLWKGHKNNTFLIPDNCNHDFSFWRHTVEFLIIWEKHAVPFHRLPLELEFKLLDPSFFTLDSWQHTSPHLLHCMGAKDQ